MLKWVIQLAELILIVECIAELGYMLFSNFQHVIKYVGGYSSWGLKSVRIRARGSGPSCSKQGETKQGQAAIFNSLP